MKLSLLDSIHLADAEVTRWGAEPDYDGDATDTQRSEIPQPLLHRIGRPAIPQVTERILHLTSPFEGGMTPRPFARKPSSGPPGIFETGAEIDDDQIEAMERLRHKLGFDRFPPERGGVSRALVAAITDTVPDMEDPAATLRGSSPIPPADVSAAGFLNHIFLPGENVVLLYDVWDKGHPFPVGRDDAGSVHNDIEEYHFLINPVDGEIRRNAWGRRPSIRNTGCITSFRHLLLRFSSRNLGQTLRMICALPLRIVSVTTSPGNQVDVLIRVGATSYEGFRMKRPYFSNHGAALGAERKITFHTALSRLPHVSGEEGGQELLYLNPEPTTCPISILAKPSTQNPETFLQSNKNSQK